MPNRLTGETSPYLLQHADNPVDWYPWGPEALERARRDDLPILLSIGYAACHWCHVMAHESFEDAETAALMNERFVNIKVDREERPDLDSVYMQAVQAMTGHGGWPMTVFLTPAGEPFYGGTYFPPADRHGMPSFRRVLESVSDAYRTRREDVAKSAESLRRIYDAAVPQAGLRAGADGALDADALERAHRALAAQYDVRNGGFGGAPKFPPTMVLDFLLRHWARTGEIPAREMAHDTFLHIARGGIHDQIGGGIARYSVDERWLVPHFEKMLYDNALLLRFGAHLYEATRDPVVRETTERIVEWLEREMTSEEGGFHSSLDADSEGHEGKFYLWTPEEMDTLLGADSAIVKAYYGVTPSGNFEGKTILNVPASDTALAGRAGVSIDEMHAAVNRARSILYAARARRVWPGRDDKVLASWNGLAVRGLLAAAKAFDDERAASLALRNLDLVEREMIVDDRVMRARRAGVTRITGFLEDQASVALAMAAAFEHTFELRYLQRARGLTRVMLDAFWDEASGTFYDTARDAEQLVTRPRDATDNAIPSGTSLAVDLLLRLSTLDGNDEYRGLAERVMNGLAPIVERYPSAFGHLLGDAEYAITFACHGDYCDMPSPEALEIARSR